MESKPAIAKSGRQFINKSHTGSTLPSARSAYNSCPAERLDLSQAIKRERTELCRTVYRWRAVAQGQFDSTCLLVCGCPLAQSGQEGSCARPQRFRFAAVGRT